MTVPDLVPGPRRPSVRRGRWTRGLVMSVACVIEPHFVPYTAGRFAYCLRTVRVPRWPASVTAPYDVTRARKNNTGFSFSMTLWYAPPTDDRTPRGRPIIPTTA